MNDDKLHCKSQIKTKFQIRSFSYLAEGPRLGKIANQPSRHLLKKYKAKIQQMSHLEPVRAKSAKSVEFIKKRRARQKARKKLKNRIARFIASRDQSGDAAYNRAKERWQRLTPEHAKMLLEHRRKSLGPLGCWLTGGGYSSPAGYCNINLYNSYSKIPSQEKQKIEMNVKLHQLASLASGSWNILATLCRNAGTKDEDTYQVSHLCHNTSCFNPDHVVVEEGSVNKERSKCKGREHIVLINPGVAEYHPCSHTDGGIRRPCILPVRKITKSELLQNMWLANFRSASDAKP